MAELEKAKLQKVKANKAQTVDGDEIPVQFNPTSLKLKITNQSDGGRSRGRNKRQNNGQSSTVLSMDLIFDSADEGSDKEPVSVRTKTSLVEQFVLPKPKSSEPPPLVRFAWDKLIIIGIIESLDIEFDHFAANGAPLRAKMSVSIKEQEPKYAYLEQGKGVKNSNNAENSGSNSQAATPGSGTNDASSNAAPANSDRSAPALAGESAPEFMARQGLDPSAWRGLDVDLSAGLSLEAGVEVGFSAGLNASIGVGVELGVLAQAGVSLEASLGISGSAVVATGAALEADVVAGQASKKINGDSAGLALAAAGGVEAAIATVKKQESQRVVAKTQTAFAAPDNTAPSSLSAVQRTPLTLDQDKAIASIASAARVTATSLVDDAGVDPRIVSYGYGVPLQPLYAAALTQKQVRLCSFNDQRLNSDNGPQFRKQKTTAPWLALPQRDQGRKQAELAEAQRRQHPCDYIYHPCSCDK